MESFILGWLILFVVYCCSLSEDSKKPPVKKKDVRDYDDSDFERLYEQWEEGEEQLEEDELPEWKRKPQSKIDLSKLDPTNPEAMLKLSKKGQTLMMFVTVSGNPSKRELEDITQLWQTSLQNAHMDVQRFVIDSKRVILMFKDGSRAWEAKDYIIQQDRCEEVTLEGRSYPGKGATSTRKPDKEL